MKIGIAVPVNQYHRVGVVLYNPYKDIYSEWAEPFQDQLIDTLEYWSIQKPGADTDPVDEILLTGSRIPDGALLVLYSLFPGADVKRVGGEQVREKQNQFRDKLAQGRVIFAGKSQLQRMVVDRFQGNTLPPLGVAAALVI